MFTLSSLLSRHYVDERDLSNMVELINLCATVDYPELKTSVDELRRSLADPDVDLSQDLRLWYEGEQLLGFGRLRTSPATPDSEDSSHLWFQVHPAARHLGLEMNILAWGEQRIEQIELARQNRIKLRTGARESEPERIAFLQAQGFVAERYFYRMGRSLLEPIPLPQFPTGFSLRSVEEQDAVLWVEMFNQTFIDHWNFHPMTVEQWHHYGTDPNYRPDHDLVAVSPEGRLAAFCYCHISPERNQRTGRNEGYVNLLGTRRGFRGQGLGRAMLLAGLHRLRQSGVETALLGVDADNPSGALQLYQSVGFSQRDSRTVFAKFVSAP